MSNSSEEQTRIGLKLGAAFSVLVAILIGIGLLGLSRMDQINANLDTVLGRQWSTMQLSREALRYSTRNSRITMQIFFLKDKRVIDSLLTTRAENTQKISELVVKLEPLVDSPEEKRLLAAVKDARAPYITSYLRALHLLIDEKNPEASRAVMAQETTPALFKYHNAWEAFMQFQMNEMEQAAKDSRAHHATIRTLTRVLISIAVLVACVIAVFMTRTIDKEMKTRIRAESEVKELNAELEERVIQRTRELANAEEQLRRSLGELQEYTKEVEGLNELVELLHSCITLPEAHSQVARVLPRFFSVGALLMLNSSRNLLDTVAAWGSPSLRPGPFSPESCWGLRRSGAHLVEGGNFSMVCGHVDPGKAGSHLCVPMMAQGDSLGVLYLEDSALATSPESLQRRKKFAVTLAEQMALAFGNLTLRESLKFQSVRDPLTGLFNRRHMEESLERELLRAARNRKPVSVFMIDVDNFKQLNDSFGHEAGDILLRELGALFTSQIRGGDIACRYGGEEFLIILMDADLGAACQRAEGLRAQTRTLQVHHRGQTLRHITVSIGVAAFPEHGTAAQQIINAADRALYQAKTGGRNRVMVAHLPNGNELDIEGTTVNSGYK